MQDHEMQRRTSIITSIIAIALAVLSGFASLPLPDVMKAKVASYQLPNLPAQAKESATLSAHQALVA
jgi:hypothetical protein